MEERLGGFSSDLEGVLKCSECKIKIQGVSTENIKRMLDKMHIKFSPWCPNVKELSEFKRMKSSKASTLNVDSAPPPQANDVVPINSFFIPKVEHPDLSTHELRQSKFLNFESGISAASFAAAGFFLNSPPRDKVTCYWCNGSLEGWKTGDIPIEEHAKYYPGCAYVRQQKGTKFIYSALEKMNSKERDFARNLIYKHNLEILDEHYKSYDDVNNRMRSLQSGELTEIDALLLAKDGFHYSINDGLFVCFYCGLRMKKNLDTKLVVQTHMAKCKNCQTNRDPDADSVNYVILFPCEDIIRNEGAGYCTARKTCPKCAKEVTSLTTLRNNKNTITLCQSQQLE